MTNFSGCLLLKLCQVPTVRVQEINLQAVQLYSVLPITGFSCSMKAVISRVSFFFKWPPSVFAAIQQIRTGSYFLRKQNRFYFVVKRHININYVSFLLNRLSFSSIIMNPPLLTYKPICTVGFP